MVSLRPRIKSASITTRYDTCHVSSYFEENNVVYCSLESWLCFYNLWSRLEQCICYFAVAGLLGVGPENKSMGTTKSERMSKSTVRSSNGEF